MRSDGRFFFFWYCFFKPAFPFGEPKCKITLIVHKNAQKATTYEELRQRGTTKINTICYYKDLYLDLPTFLKLCFGYCVFVLGVFRLVSL